MSHGKLLGLFALLATLGESAPHDNFGRFKIDLIERDFDLFLKMATAISDGRRSSDGTTRQLAIALEQTALAIESTRMHGRNPGCLTTAFRALLGCVECRLYEERDGENGKDKLPLTSNGGLLATKFKRAGEKSETHEFIQILVDFCKEVLVPPHENILTNLAERVNNDPFPWPMVQDAIGAITDTNDRSDDVVTRQIAVCAELVLAGVYDSRNHARRLGCLRTAMMAFTGCLQNRLEEEREQTCVIATHALGWNLFGEKSPFTAL